MLSEFPAVLPVSEIEQRMSQGNGQEAPVHGAYGIEGSVDVKADGLVFHFPLVFFAGLLAAVLLFLYVSLAFLTAMALALAPTFFAAGLAYGIIRINQKARRPACCRAAAKHHLKKDGATEHE